MTLRPYQEQLISDIRVAIGKYRSVAATMPTGSGKSHVFAAITHMAHAKGNGVWICVPRNELVWQASEHLSKRNIPHGLIKAGFKESRAYKVHVISLETIKRRIKADKIKNYPALIIFDECHIQLDGQMFVVDNLPIETKVLGFSATMERLDGRGIGINERNGKKDGLYQTLVEGPSIRDLIELGFLSNFRYFRPPLDGLDDIHRRGTEYDAEELEMLFKKRAVYGKAIDHYRREADGKKCLVFCRSVKSSEETAARFREAGYAFESIDGKMTDKKRKGLINGLKNGSLQGLTNCDILTYGLDIPAVEVGIMLRPTMSLSLYFQIIGRILRIFPGKKEAIILDHVNNLDTHFHPLQDYEWQFFGVEKRGKKKGASAAILKLCPKCFLYTESFPCPNCGNDAVVHRKNLKEVDGRLVEITGPVKLNDRPDDEKQEYVDRINGDITKYQDAEREGIIDESAVKDLLDAASELGRGVMWVYWKLSATYIDKDGLRVPRKSVNSPLLYAIGRHRGYKSGWAWMKKDEIRKRISANDAEIEMFRREVV